MKKKLLIMPLAIMLLMALMAGCKTGKGCDCPTFGQNEGKKMERF